MGAVSEEALTQSVPSPSISPAPGKRGANPGMQGVRPGPQTLESHRSISDQCARAGQGTHGRGLWEPPEGVSPAWRVRSPNILISQGFS